MSRGTGPRRPDGDHDDHQRRWLIRTLVAVGVVIAAVVGLPWVYAQVVAGQEEAPLALSTPTSAPTATPTAEPTPAGPLEVDGAWTVGEGSEAGYRLGEVLSGQQVTVVGRTDQVAGDVVVEGGVLTAATITVDVASISTDESARDAYFRRAVDVTANPEATFVLDAPVDLAALPAATGPVAVQATGTLTFHGVAVPATAELQVQRTPDGVEVAGAIPITLADFGLEAPDLGFVTVEPTGTVELLLQLVR